MHKSIVGVGVVGATVCAVLSAHEPPSKNATQPGADAPGAGRICSVFLDDGTFAGTLCFVTDNWVCAEIDWGVVGDGRHVAKSWLPRQRVRMIIEGDILESGTVGDLGVSEPVGSVAESETTLDAEAGAAEADASVQRLSREELLRRRAAAMVSKPNHCCLPDTLNTGVAPCCD